MTDRPASLKQDDGFLRALLPIVGYCMGNAIVRNWISWEEYLRENWVTEDTFVEKKRVELTFCYVGKAKILYLHYS